jgi:2-polyprenyl-3-methyl-5-hydroxy-6-metoxy-1,4-benzoquinol methylase
LRPLQPVPLASNGRNGARAQDGADVQEATVRPLYEEIFERTQVGPGTALLDVGCGAGLACTVAAAGGASVVGLDATPELLAIARQRLAEAEFHLGDMEALPYPEGRFDVITGFNSFQYAPIPSTLWGKPSARRGLAVRWSSLSGACQRKRKRRIT